MRNRAKQREARRSRDWLNAEGYRDPTAFLALRNIERAKKNPKSKNQIRKTAVAWQ